VRLNSNSRRAAEKRKFAAMDRRFNSRKNLARRQAYRTGSAADRTEANRLGNEVKFALIDHRTDRWERKLKSLTAEDNSIWRMTKALRSSKKPLPPIHGTRGLVFSDDEKAETFADSL
ncbi:unnamed protein product, partial [Tenebrio molitor]